jgi:hypothetical protein
MKMTWLIRQFSKPALLSALLATLASNSVSGQGRNEEITIIAPYIPSIQNATKIPFRPEVSPGEPDQQVFEYDYITRSIPVTTELDPVEPMKFSGEKQGEVYGNYAKAGFGNYLTPYLEFLASSKQSEDYLVGARFRHHSSQGGMKDYANNAFSRNLVSVYGKSFLSPGTLSGDIGYNREVVHYYGFPLDSFPDLEISKEELRQRFQHFWLGVDFNGQNKAKEPLKYSIGTGFHFYNDRWDTREIQLDVNGSLDKQLSGTGSDFRHGLKFDIGLEYVSYKDTAKSLSPLIFNLVPVYRFGFGQYDFEVGLSLSLSSDESEGGSGPGVDVFPHLRADISIVENELKAYALVSGYKKVNTYRSLTSVNPYLTSSPELINTDQQISISGGLTGNAAGLNFNAEVSYSYNDNLPLFVNDTTIALQNKFKVLYDDVNLLNIKGSIGYLKVRSLEARLMASFYQYIPKHEEKAWHLPVYEVGLHAGYVIREKFILTGDLFILGNGYARSFDENGLQAVKLDPAFDLNLGFEYRITSKLSAFINVNNILNQHYQRWYQYPVQGIQVMAGATYSF